VLEILEYPFDVSKILRKKKVLRRHLLEKEILVDIKIAVLGATTTFEVIEQLELFLLKAGFKPTFYVSDYGQHYNVVDVQEAKTVQDFVELVEAYKK